RQVRLAAARRAHDSPQVREDRRQERHPALAHERDRFLEVVVVDRQDVGSVVEPPSDPAHVPRLEEVDTGTDLAEVLAHRCSVPPWPAATASTRTLLRW